MSVKDTKHATTTFETEAGHVVSVYISDAPGFPVTATIAMTLDAMANRPSGTTLNVRNLTPNEAHDLSEALRRAAIEAGYKVKR